MFEGCTFNVTGDAYAVWTYGASDVTFDNCTFNTDGKAILVYTEGAHTAEINVNKCTFNATTNRNKAAVEVGQSAGENKANYTLNFNNSTADNNFVQVQSKSNLWGNKNGMDTTGLQVVENGKVVYGTAVAKIGTTEYLTIQAAVDAAEKGSVITLIGDITEKGIKVAADKQITLDLNNKTLTGDILSEGILTVKNGTINSEEFISAIESCGENAMLKTAKLNVTSQRHALRIEGGSAEILSGTYTTLSRGGEQTSHAVNAGGEYATEVLIKNGTFNGIKASALVTTADSGAAVNAQKNAIVTIENGTFVGGQNNTLNTSKDGKIIVNGGTYDQDPTAYLNPAEEGLKVGNAAYAKLWTVINDSRRIVPEADKTEVEADGIVTIAVKVYGENLREGYWNLTYDTTKFVCITDAAANGTIMGTKTLNANTTDVFADGETLATYEFKAIAQNAEVTGAFETVGVRTYTASESKDGYTFGAAGGKAEVAIKLTAYEVVVKVDGEKVTGTSAEVPYTAEKHTFEVTSVPGIAADDVIEITMTDEEGNEVTEMIEKGTYTITYTIPAQPGFAEYNGTFELTIGSPEYVVEVNTGKGYFADYVLGKKLVLAYTNTPNVAFEYDGNYMINVSAKGYLYNDVTEYEYVYAIVVDALPEGSTVDDYIAEGNLKDVKLTNPVASLVTFDYDINSNGELHLSDIISIYDTYNVDEADLFNEESYRDKLIFARSMNIILKSDVDGNKTVTGDDTENVVTAVYAELNK